MEYEDYSNKSEFNTAIGMVNRMDAILTEISIYSKNNDFPKWFECLGTLSREIKFLLTPKERKVLDECFVAGSYLCSEFKKNMVLGRDGKYSSGINSEVYIELGLYDLFYKLLDTWDTKIKEYLDAKELIIKKKKDVTKSVGDM